MQNFIVLREPLFAPATNQRNTFLFFYLTALIKVVQPPHLSVDYAHGKAPKFYLQGIIYVAQRGTFTFTGRCGLVCPLPKAMPEGLLGLSDIHPNYVSVHEVRLSVSRRDILRIILTSSLDKAVKSFWLRASN